MKIYTSYFGNARKLQQAGIKMISIARWQPKFFDGPCYYPAAPYPSMLKGKISREEYINKYNNSVLAKLEPAQVIRNIEQLSGGADVALCCYEKPGDFCHRHLFAAWLRDKTGVDVKEFMAEKKKQAYVEQSLLD